MGRIYFFRHGKTISNVNKIFCGITDSSLIERTKIHFPIVDTVFCSPLKRCSAYLDFLEIEKKNIIISDDLKEINFGLWEGKTFIEIENQYPKKAKSYLKNPLKFKFPSGESYKIMKQRTKKFINTELQKFLYSKNNILIISHEGNIKTLLINLLRLSDDFFFKIEIQNEKICTVVYYDNYFVLSS